MTEMNTDAVAAVFGDQAAADRALHKLLTAGFKAADLSFVGKACHDQERVLGLIDHGRGAKFWGVRGVLWNRLWTHFGGGLFLTTPTTGPAFVLGQISFVAGETLDAALIIGGMSAVGTALYSIGIPRDDAQRFEDAVCHDHFLLMVHGNALDLAVANLRSSGPEYMSIYHRLARRMDLAA